MRALLGWIMGGLLFFGVASCQAADKVPDGEYNCHKLSGGKLILLGSLEIKDMTYRFDPKGPYKKFTIDAQNNITWTESVDIMPDGWKVGVSKFEGPNAQGEPRLTIRYTSASGNAEVIDAVKEKK